MSEVSWYEAAGSDGTLRNVENIIQRKGSHYSSG
jgi:hypothetical protein